MGSVKLARRSPRASSSSCGAMRHLRFFSSVCQTFGASSTPQGAQEISQRSQCLRRWKPRIPFRAMAQRSDAARHVPSVGHNRGGWRVGHHGRLSNVERFPVPTIGARPQQKRAAEAALRFVAVIRESVASCTLMPPAAEPFVERRHRPPGKRDG